MEYLRSLSIVSSFGGDGLERLISWNMKLLEATVIGKAFVSNLNAMEGRMGQMAQIAGNSASQLNAEVVKISQNGAIASQEIIKINNAIASQSPRQLHNINQGLGYIHSASSMAQQKLLQMQDVAGGMGGGGMAEMVNGIRQVAGQSAMANDEIASIGATIQNLSGNAITKVSSDISNIANSSSMAQQKLLQMQDVAKGMGTGSLGSVGVSVNRISETAGLSAEKITMLKERLQTISAGGTEKAANDLDRLRQMGGLTSDQITRFTGVAATVEKQMIEAAGKFGLTKEKLDDLRMAAAQDSEIKNFAKKYNLAASDVKRAVDEIQENTNRMGTALQSVAALGIGTKFIQMGGSMIRASADFEQTRVSFDVMMGSAEKAKAMLSTLQDFANKTPFDTTKIIESGKMLIGAGITDAGEMQRILTNLGNVSAGSGKDLKELIFIYNQVMAKGKLTGDDMNQLLNAQIPIRQELAKMLGVSNDAIFDMVSKGAVSSEHVKVAMGKMASAGGLYAGLMEKQSQTATGLWSSITSNIAMWGRKIGDMVLVFIKPMLFFLNWLTDAINKNAWAMGILKTAVLLLIPVIGIVLIGSLYSAIKAFGILDKTTLKMYGDLIKRFAPWFAFAAAIGFVILLIEDLYVWINGGESLLGQWLGKWEELGAGIKMVIYTVIGLISGLMIFLGLMVVGVAAFPALIVGAVVAGLVAIGAVIYAHWDDIKQFLSDSWTWITDLFGSLVGWFANIWKQVSLKISIAIDMIKNIIGRGVQRIIDFVKDYGKEIIMALFPISLLYLYWDDIVGFFGELGQAIVDKISGFWDFLINKFDDLVAWFTALPDTIGAELTRLATMIKEKIPFIDKLGDMFSWAGGDVNVEARASGGPVSAGKPYIVGEFGPELLIPGVNGTIVPSVSPIATPFSGGKSVSINMSPVINISGSATAEDGERASRAFIKYFESMIPQMRLQLGLEAG